MAKKSCLLGQQNQIAIPDVFFFPLNFVAAFLDNIPVTLPKRFTKCCKLNSSLGATWPQNNIFLHFQPFNDSGTGTAGQGRLKQLGCVPWVLPLELATRNGLFLYRFESGFPTQLYLSADYQGNGPYTDIIAFFGDDVDITTFK